MRTVTVRVPAIDLSREMVAMRGWLDHNRYEPTRFDCGKSGDEVVLSVDFRTAAAAEAFARRFDGESRPPVSEQGRFLPAAGIGREGRAG